jgi:hypothetical protein
MHTNNDDHMWLVLVLGGCELQVNSILMEPTRFWQAVAAARSLDAACGVK